MQEPVVSRAYRVDAARHLLDRPSDAHVFQGRGLLSPYRPSTLSRPC
jgi:hypothetical protein